MKFLLQTNLLNPKEISELKDILSKYPTDYVTVIPFSDELSVSPDQDYIPYGSTSLTVNGKKKYNWSGVHFSYDTFNYSAALHNRDDMLNENVMPIEDAIEYLSKKEKDEIVFVRPSDDLKQFTGMTIDAGEAHLWFKDMLECQTSGSYKLDTGTMVVVSSPKKIDAEVRCFIVGGKVVSSSLYREFDNLVRRRYYEDCFQSFADKWLPDACCVMDLAFIDNEWKVVEFNCINSSGMYDCDRELIFKHLWEYHNKG